MKPHLALLVAAVTALLAACSGETKPAKGAGNQISLQVFADPAETASYRAMIAAFEQQAPGSKVELRPVGKQKDHMARLATAFAGGDPPDLFILNFRRYGQFAGKGALAALGPEMTAEGSYRAQDFYETASEAFRYRGTQYCLPQNISSLVVYYNRALFQARKVPEPKDDWRLIEDFLPAAQQLTYLPSGGDFRQQVHGIGFEPSLIRQAPFVWMFGGGLVNDIHRPSLMMLDRSRAVAALTWLRALRTREGVSPSQAEVQAEDLESRFAAGRLAMLLQSRRYTAALRELDQQGQKLDWDVAPLPSLGKPVTVLHSDGYCMAKASKNPKLAKAFVAFALSDLGQSILAKSGRIVPSRISTASSPAFLDATQKPARAKVFLDAIPHMRRTPNSAAWHEVESKADTLLEEFYYEPPLPTETGLGHGEARLVAEAIRDAAQPLLLQDLAKKGR